MTEWLFTFVVLAFPAPDDAQFIDANALIIKSEMGEAGGKQADAFIRKKYEGKWVMTTCDQIKSPVSPLEMKRGNKS